MSASTTIITNLKSATAPTANSVSDANVVGRDANGMLALALTIPACASTGDPGWP